MEEQEAVARLKRNELRGLDFLILRYQVRAVQAAYLITGDRAQAEDIAQSAFLKAVDKIGGFDNSRPFGPWFLRIVTNLALRAAYRQNREISFETGEESPVPPAWIIDPSRGPEELADTTEVRAALMAALMKLTPRQRAVTVMHYFLEMPAGEISRELDSPLTAIKWSLFAARERLRSLLRSFAPAGQPSFDSSHASQKSRGEL